MSSEPDNHPPDHQAPLPARSAGHRARTAGVFLIAELTGRLAAFVMFAIAARILGPSGFGAFSYAYAYALLATSFVVWGFDMAVIQLGSRDRSRLDELLTLSLACRLTITLVTLPVVAIATLGEPENRAIILVMTATTAIETVNNSVRAAASVADRQRSVAFNFTIQKIVIAVLAVGVLMAGYGVLAMSVAYLIGTTLGAAAMLVNATRLPARIRPSLLSRAGLVEFMHQARMPGTANLLNQANARFDMLALGRFGTMYEVGVLGAAYRLFDAAQMFFNAIARAAVPPLAQAPSMQNVRELVRQLISAIAVLHLPIAAVFIFRGDEVMALMFGPQFGASGRGPMALFGLALLAYVNQGMLATALQARHHSHQVARNSTIALVVKLVVTVPLVITWGATGAAAAVLISFTAQLAAQWFSLARVGGAPRVGRVLVAPVAAFAAMSVVLVTPLPLITACALGCLVFVMVWWPLAGRTDPMMRNRVAHLVKR